MRLHAILHEDPKVLQPLGFHADGVAVQEQGFESLGHTKTIKMSGARHNGLGDVCMLHMRKSEA